MSECYVSKKPQYRTLLCVERLQLVSRTDIFIEDFILFVKYTRLQNLGGKYSLYVFVSLNILYEDIFLSFPRIYI